jgi:hypothetical protein
VSEEIAELLSLGGAGLEAALAYFEAGDVEAVPVTGYQQLTEVELVAAPGGARIYRRGPDLALVYLGARSLPAGLSAATIADALGTQGEELSSRQGKTALLHVVAERGVAWSEDDDELGFVELFPATDLDDYRSRIYREPRFR